MRKKKIAAIALALWLSIITVLMLLSERIDLSLFFVLGFIGFIVIVELMEPHYVRPRNLWYTHFLIAVGIVIFVAIVVQKVLDILGLELVFG
jgi:ABC-type xylose transport system permease subunit